MSRLVDVDKNREDFKKTVYCILKDDFSTSKVKFNKIMTAFDSMPTADTAYPVDKVVEELERLADECYKAYCIGFNSDDRAEYDAYTNAVEIVKAGGMK